MADESEFWKGYQAALGDMSSWHYGRLVIQPVNKSQRWWDGYRYALACR